MASGLAADWRAWIAAFCAALGFLRFVVLFFTGHGRWLVPWIVVWYEKGVSDFWVP